MFSLVLGLESKMMEGTTAFLDDIGFLQLQQHTGFVFAL